MLVALDIGREVAKARDKYGEVAFPSWISTAVEMGVNYVRNPKHMILDYTNHPSISSVHFVGELGMKDGKAKRRAYDERKDVPETLIIALGALYRLGIKNKKVQIVTGIPIDNMKRQDEVDGVKELLKGLHRFKMNGEEIWIDIEAVYVTAEGAAPFWIDPPVYMGEAIKVGVIDTGSYTYNCATYFVDEDGPEFIAGESFTEEKGWRKSGVNGEDLGRLILSDINLHTEWSDWEKQGGKLIVLVCGGRDLEANTIKEALSCFKDVRVIADPQMANVRGYYEMGSEMLEEVV